MDPKFTNCAKHNIPNGGMVNNTGTINNSGTILSLPQSVVNTKPTIPKSTVKIEPLPTSTQIPYLIPINVPSTSICQGCNQTFLRVPCTYPNTAQYYRCSKCLLSSPKNILASCILS